MFVLSIIIGLKFKIFSLINILIFVTYVYLEEIYESW